MTTEVFTLRDGSQLEVTTGLTGEVRNIHIECFVSDTARCGEVDLLVFN